MRHFLRADEKSAASSVMMTPCQMDLDSLDSPLDTRRHS